jgi:cellulose synthase/poly-beta-1,6-N-acetylglucosamine synthase-like glycosyltransferase
MPIGEKILISLFWLSLLTILYTYFLYPLLLKVLSLAVRLRPGTAVRLQNESSLPNVTMVISAYNEERVLPDKIENCMRLKYPTDKITFLFGSDGSDDHTWSLLRGIKDPRFTVRHNPKRRGKVQVLNDLMSRVTSDIVVFSDANTMYEPDAITELVNSFSDQRVGCVIGKLDLVAPETDPDACHNESLYWRYENSIKQLENHLGIVPTINGGIFAIRRELYEELPGQAVTEDQVLGMRIMVKGYRCLFAAGALATETVSNLKGELRRRIRISAGNFQSLFLVKGVFRCGARSFAFISHKVLRWMVPFCLITMLLANILLIGRLFYGSTMLCQGIFYAAGLTAILLPKLSAELKVFSIPKYFLTMNLAILIGFTRFIAQTQPVAWTKATRK